VKFKLPLLLLWFSCVSLCLTAQAQALSQPQYEVDDTLRAALRQSIEQADSFDDRFDAEVWLVAKSHSLQRFIKDPQERFRILRLVHREATRAGVPPDLVLAVIQIESAFDPYAVSRVGAQGMMQVMPFWKKEIGREQDSLIDLETNLRYGCAILKHYIDREKGRWAEGLARYNGSYGKYWYPEKVMTAWQKYWRH
jgi:soluble lytic murein transglycosylase-like protein